MLLSVLVQLTRTRSPLVTSQLPQYEGTPLTHTNVSGKHSSGVHLVKPLNDEGG